MNATPLSPEDPVTGPEDPAHYSGILVMCRPGDLEAAASRIDGLPGAEVHMRDAGAGRLIAVLESRDAAGQERLLDRIRRVPGVAAAALVYHYVDRPGAEGLVAGEAGGGA